MTRKPTHRMKTMFSFACLTLAMLVGAATANARDRAERWEFELGLLYQLGTEIDGENGSFMETDNDFGLEFMAGYNINEKVETTFGFQWASVDYQADVVDDGGGSRRISGSYDTWALSGNLIYNFSDGPFTPYIGAGIGYTWIDSNIPNGLPSTGCWWDPWWGYVCYTSYPTKTTDSFSYQALLGVRYEFGYNKFMRFGYSSQWMDLGGTTSNPRFDVFKVNMGWLF
jgi:opacity protein-like surface antigen